MPHTKGKFLTGFLINGIGETFGRPDTRHRETSGRPVPHTKGKFLTGYLANGIGETFGRPDTRHRETYGRPVPDAKGKFFKSWLSHEWEGCDDEMGSRANLD